MESNQQHVQIEVDRVYTVSPDVIAIEIAPEDVIKGKQIPYKKQSKDTVSSNGWVTRNGKIIGKLMENDRSIIRTLDKYDEAKLDTKWATLPQNFRINSKNDSDFKAGIRPDAVFRKSKITTMARVGPWKFDNPTKHTLYLKLPKALEKGKGYEIDFAGNVLKDINFSYKPENTRSEAVRVSHLGFDPGDPAKVAFLSTWMGEKGGGLQYKPGMNFSLIDQKTGRKVYSGKTVLSKSKNQAEDKRGKNYNGTDVYMMDFSDFNKAGKYQVAVEGVGTSFTFEIGEKTWQNAFKTSARGMYHQRSGIKLGQPYTNFTRPRAFHPKDGVKVYQSTVSLMDTDMGLTPNKSAFKALVNTKTNKLVPEAWGGWMDAGDWDRRAHHMEVSRLYLELAETNPNYFKQINLNIPESNNNIPDIIDEALWGLDFFKRMQTPEGGIRGGVESAEHPKEFEASWQESLTIMAYGPGMWSSYMYAGVAARAAHVLQKIDPSKAKEYQSTAIKAMEWAEKEFAKNTKKLPTEVADERNLAAAELYRLTGENKWHQLFLDTTVFKNSNAKVFEYKKHNQEAAAFVYARTEHSGINKGIQKNAVNAISQEADSDINAINNTGFKWNKNPYAPLGWGDSLGAPDTVTLIRAHALTNNQKYLKAGVLASQFSAGANPDNMIYTTGMGYRSPQDPLIVDLQATGQAPPPGITVYGPLDTKAYGRYWALDKMPEISPDPAKWPVAEGYFDFYHYVPVTEYTVHQSIAPTTYTWGYFAAIDEKGSKTSGITPQSNPNPGNSNPINSSPGNPNPSPTQPPVIPLPKAKKVRYEVENLNLDGYVVETVNGSNASAGRHISLKGGKNQGKATGTFQGESGKYQVKVGYYDENDGVSLATVKVADKTANLKFDRNLPSNWAKASALTSKITHNAVELKSGDRFEISGQINAGEFARFDYIEFTPIKAKNNTAVKNSNQINMSSNNNSTISNNSNTNRLTTPSAFEQEVLRLTNEFRKENGLPPLKFNSDLVEAAQSYSQDMAQKDFFSHTGKDGSTPLERSQKAGYSPSAIGENIAAGQRTPEQVVRGWINSPGHRANLLNPNYTEIGVGHVYQQNDTGDVNYNHYWTQLFGRPQNVVASNSGNSSPGNGFSGNTNPTNSSSENINSGNRNNINPAPQNTKTNQNNFAQEVLRLTNEFRKQNGLSPLKFNSDLVEAAQSYSEDMGKKDFFSHKGKDGSTPLERSKDAGYSPSAIGENIAAGQRTPEQVVQGWINSPGHRANLLNPNYTEIGVGYFHQENDTGSVNYNHYWTQIFGRPQNVAASNSGNSSPGNINTKTGNNINPTPQSTNTDNQKIGSSKTDKQETNGNKESDRFIGNSGNNKLIGSNKNDVMLGKGGNDTIRGKKGNDWLQGDRGNDRLIGGNGNDFLIGTKPGTSGKGERDVLRGGKDADTFVLGDKKGVYYDNGNPNDYGFKDYALIKDFNQKEGDKILLHGEAKDYRLGSVSGSKSGTGILHKDSGKDELIAIVQNTSGLKLNSNAFQFIS